MDGSGFHQRNTPRARDPEIERDIPIPPPGPRWRRRYPIKDLAVGESFFVPAGDRTAQEVASALARAAWSVKMKTGARFTVRSLGDGARLWRVA